MIFFNSQKNQSSGLASNVNTPFFSSFINFEKYIDGKFRPEGSFCDINSGIDWGYKFRADKDDVIYFFLPNCGVFADELPKNKEFANYLVQKALVVYKIKGTFDEKI